MHPGCAIPPKTPPLRGGWTRQQSAKWYHHNRSKTSETTLTSFTPPSLTHFISPFSPLWRPRPARRHLPIPTRYHYSTPHGPPSLVQLPQYPFYFPPRRSAHLDTAEVLSVEADFGGTTLTFVNVYIPPGLLLPLDFDALLMDRGDQMGFGDINAHHPSCFSRRGDDRATARGKTLDGTINSSQLAVAKLDLPTYLSSQGQPSPPDITLLSVLLLPDVRWSTLTILGSDHLPITVSLSSHAPLSLRKGHSYTNFHRAYWEGFTVKSERRFVETPQPSCSAGDKCLLAYLQRRLKIPHTLR